MDNVDKTLVGVTAVMKLYKEFREVVGKAQVPKDHLQFTPEVKKQLGVCSAVVLEGVSRVEAAHRPFFLLCLQGALLKEIAGRGAMPEGFLQKFTEGFLQKFTDALADLLSALSAFNSKSHLYSVRKVLQHTNNAELIPKAEELFREIRVALVSVMDSEEGQKKLDRNVEAFDRTIATVLQVRYEDL